ncbi:MAG: DUF2924 domain-containing protein [Luteimonas sp.]|nr:DUF2924 domain-containing protein [Luteimonas sp.]
MDNVLSRVVALRSAPTAALKQQWRDLFGSEAPPYNRRLLESRLAYRLQELAYGGLSPAARERLDALADQVGQGRQLSVKLKTDRPVTGTRLVREWQGVEHTATVLADGYDYEGRRYKSLSAIARAITGTQWNGPLFFGLKRVGRA